MHSFRLLLAILTIMVFIGCSGKNEEQAETNVHYETATIALETMKCQMCAAFVQQAAIKVHGVAEMDVNLDRKVGTVRYNPEETNLAQIEQAIADAGYNANDTSRNEEIYATLPDCCK
jgi:copper chaperone CopZ